jgi:hypothetical protein
MHGSSSGGRAHCKLSLRTSHQRPEHKHTSLSQQPLATKPATAGMMAKKHANMRSILVLPGLQAQPQTDTFDHIL